MARIMARLSLLFVVLLTTTGITLAEEAATGRVDCIFASKANARPGEYALEMEDIPIEYCTHVIYSQIELEPETLTMRPENFEYDILQNGWDRFADLKKANPKLKLLINIHSMLTSTVIKTAAQRAKFIDLIVTILRRYKFDGISIMWFGYFDGDSEERNLEKLLEEMRLNFDAAGHPEWEVKVMISIDQTETDHSRLCKVAESVSLMNIYVVPEPTETMVVAPLNNILIETGDQEDLSVKHSLQTWLDNGCPANKLMLGFTFLGLTFNLRDSTKNGLGAPVTGRADACPITDVEGGCAYFELCQKFNETEWTFKWEDAGAIPYAYQNDQWVSYENVASIERKAEFARSKGLAGVFGMTLATDDYRGKCGEQFPLTKALWRGFQLATNTLN